LARILIIDDDPLVREYLFSLLTYRSYDVMEAPDGKIGMRLFRCRPCDLVITDLVMPDKEGIETIMELRRDYPKVKIIAISGGGTVGPDGYLSMAGFLGADRLLRKPFKTPEMMNAIQDLLFPV
jgi:DNA-binding response OmpR family regulator